MRGIVHTEHGTRLVEDLEVRPPGPTEVRVRIRAAGLCHSDLSVIDGTIPWPTPAVLGHEGAGVVESVGSAVKSLSPGDPVVLHTLASCGLCDACGSGVPTHCRETLGNLSQPFERNGEKVHNFAATSVFCEMTTVSETQAVKIDPELPLEHACLIGCGVLTGVGAVLSRARVEAGQTAAVFGIGGIGLNVVQGLRIAGASRIVAVDRLASKEEAAREFGATDFVDASRVDSVEAIRALLPHTGNFGTGGSSSRGPADAGGVDWSFECVGHPAVVGQAVEVLDWGGQCVIVGVPAADATLPIRITQLTHVDRGVLGCRYGSARPHRDIPMYVEMAKRGQLLLEPLVSKRYTLDEFDAAVADLRAGHLSRGVFIL